jgi:HSP20 family protein
MKNCLPYSSESLIYPGEYTPLPEKKPIVVTNKSQDYNIVSKPLINMDEYQDHYKIEVQIPGVKRENIFIRVFDNFLSIVVLSRECQEEKRKLQIHEFDSERLERQISLPENADTEFVSAEYRYGVLKLYIPKTAEVFRHSNNNIVVY